MPKASRSTPEALYGNPMFRLFEIEFNMGLAMVFMPGDSLAFRDRLRPDLTGRCLGLAFALVLHGLGRIEREVEG